MIKQVIVVEGKSDIARVKQAVDADIIATGGLALRSVVIEDIRRAYEKRGIIILTDPDGPGERIRRKLTKLFPKALHAFVPKIDAVTCDDVGIENASPEAIQRALSQIHVLMQENKEIFTMNDLWTTELVGGINSAKKREEIGALLGIGYGNGKQFLTKLNHFGITRKEWEIALQKYREIKNEGC